MPKSDLVLLAIDDEPIRQLFERALVAGAYGVAIARDRPALDRALQEYVNSLMIRPDLWREVFRPYYARMFERVHAAGRHVHAADAHELGGHVDERGVAVERGRLRQRHVQPRRHDLFHQRQV